jgi:hypothetical protein
MGLKTQFVYEVEMIYETTGDYMTFKYVSDEPVEDLKIFDDFVANCSIVVQGMEEEEVETDDEDDSDIYTVKVEEVNA